MLTKEEVEGYKDLCIAVVMMAIKDALDDIHPYSKYELQIFLKTSPWVKNINLNGDWLWDGVCKKDFRRLKRLHEFKKSII